MEIFIDNDFCPRLHFSKRMWLDTQQCCEGLHVIPPEQLTSVWSLLAARISASGKCEISVIFFRTCAFASYILLAALKTIRNNCCRGMWCEIEALGVKCALQFRACKGWHMYKSNVVNFGIFPPTRTENPDLRYLVILFFCLEKWAHWPVSKVVICSYLVMCQIERQYTIITCQRKCTNMCLIRSQNACQTNYQNILSMYGHMSGKLSEYMLVKGQNSCQTYCPNISQAKPQGTCEVTY